MTRSPIEAVVIGASSGAVEALSVVLSLVRNNFSLPIMIVVHVPPDRPSAMADLFRVKCRVAVREAEDKEPIQSGIIYFAPPDYHLLVELDKTFSLSSEEPVHYSRPSIDVLFETAADAYGPALLGIVLTGANCDGAAGLKKVWEAGGTPLVQLPETAQSSTMPAAAIASCPAAQVMTLEAIAEYLNLAGQADE